MGTSGQQHGGGRGTVVVRDVGTQRGSASARAMVAASEELGQVLSAAVGRELWAELFGVRVLRADDTHGHGHGLVVQHDEVRWADVLEVALFATPAVERLGHPRPECAIDGSCDGCRVVRALGRLRSTWQASGLSLDQVGAGYLAAAGQSTGRDWPAPTGGTAVAEERAASGPPGAVRRGR